MRHALVTGARGFIGRHLTLALKRNGVCVTTSGRPHFFGGNSGSHHIELASFDELDAALLDEVDVVFHMAAITDTHADDNGELLRSNVDEPLRLFERAVRRGCRVVYASSMAVYGNVAAPFRESGEHQPLSAYGRSKLKLDERATDLAAATNGVIVGLRYSNVYGPGEAHKGQMASMAYQLLQQMRTGRPVLFEDGSQRRDFVYVGDAVTATLLAVSARRSRVINCGGGCSVSFLELVDAINRVLGTSQRPKFIKNPLAHLYQSNVEMDLTLARSEICYQPTVSLADGIQRMIECGV